jgi:protoheme IX farnesyltransferase
MNQPFEQHDSGAASSSAVVVEVPALSRLRTKLADYAELAKIRIGGLVLVVTATCYCLASPHEINFVRLLHTLIGTGLVAAAANALNQVMEWRTDRLMRRTADRPIPAGRMSVAEGFALGAAATVFGGIYLVVFVNTLAASIAWLTVLLYLFAYTPLKRYTAANTVVGAVPGAMPALIGSAAAIGSIDPYVWMVFSLLFLWQLPHFFAIAWMYREDYARGGYRMLSVVDPTGGKTARHSNAWCIAMIAVSFAPSIIGHAGISYSIAATVLGAAMLYFTVRLAMQRSRESARSVLLASVIYLPAMLLALLLDRVAG